MMLLAKNTTVLDIQLSNLDIPGGVIVAGGQADLLQYNTLDEVASDDELFALIQAGDVILNDGIRDLTVTEALSIGAPATTIINQGSAWEWVQSFNGDEEKDYIEAKHSSWRVMSTFIFPGSDSVTVTRLRLILSRSSNSGTSYIELRDPSTKKTLVSFTYTSKDKTLYELTGLSNVPASSSMLELWAKRSGGKTRIHYASLG